MRTVASILVTIGLVVSLAACSSTPTAAPVNCTPTPSGAISDAVKVTGNFGSKPTVKVAFPTAAKTTERTVVITGTGPTAQTGDTVNVDLTIINGATGVELTSSKYAASSTASVPLDPAKFLPGFVKTLQCTQVGSRVVGVIPPADAFGATGSTQLGVAAGQDIVFVADLVSINPPTIPPLTKANGADQPATAGIPTVVLGADGAPTVTIPDGAPPTTLKLAELKLGTGAVVKAGDSVVVHYVGVNWNTKKVFDSSWSRGTAATFKTNQVIAGFTAALVGQKVGSQVIVIIPPDQGYGAAGSPPNIGGTDTLVFVVDILGIG